MVEKGGGMTENKRYNIKPSKIMEDGFCIQDNEREHSFPTVDDKSHLIMYEKALNEQDERIRELEKENETLKDTIDGLTGTMAHMEDLCDGDVE